MNKKQIKYLLSTELFPAAVDQLKRLTYKDQKLLLELSEAAQVWGWERDQGTSNVDKARQAYNLLLARLAQRIADQNDWHG